MNFIEKLESLKGKEVVLVADEKLDKQSGRDQGTLEEVYDDFIVFNAGGRKYNVSFSKIVAVAEVN